MADAIFPIILCKLYFSDIEEKVIFYVICRTRGEMLWKEGYKSPKKEKMIRLQEITSPHFDVNARQMMTRDYFWRLGINPTGAHGAHSLDVNKGIKRWNRLCLPHAEISTLSAISGADILQRSEYVSLDSLSESDFRRSLNVEMKSTFY